MSEEKRPIFEITPYIYSEREKRNLREHAYHGGDNGITYIYFYNPVANYLVGLLPESLAPNTITMAGFLCVVIPYVLMVVLFGPDLYGPLPSWFCFLFAFCYFTYRMLDEMDGK
jgi:ethanolaminephosphotransferase